MLQRATSTFSRRVLLAAQVRCMSSYQPNIEDIKKLRAASQAPMKDVKKALVESEGDFAAAYEWLRKKGIATATAKAGRVAAEGLVGIFVDADKKRGAIVEMNSETDFVARNEQFQALLADVTRTVHADASVGQYDNAALSALTLNGRAVGDYVPELVGRVGENLVLQRATSVAVAHGVVSHYVHRVASAALGLGQAGAIVALEASKPLSDAERADLDAVGKKLAMHIVAAKPRFLNRESVPADRVAAERAFVLEQVADQAKAKPANVVEKMIDGRMNKFFGEVTLVDQQHMVEEGAPKVAAVLDKASAKLGGATVSLVGFQRFEIGEEQL
ncbi:Aste57867_12202 [Aphanomyces stellatus]|uniref:Elongation factor Ts, mitochondrial n=1 Tax=Aphanomyces stellatus TaxID=120398 RepID=A0A485KUY3_9STRA|nr:hypothetical protein As57867_012157 [Aphanomyces stellatus]VFT89056.1 Aste57867_12202 [Aphanomyces stellatus]